MARILCVSFFEKEKDMTSDVESGKGDKASIYCPHPTRLELKAIYRYHHKESTKHKFFWVEAQTFRLTKVIMRFDKASYFGEKSLVR